LSREKESQEIRTMDEHVKLLRKDMDQRLSDIKVQVDALQARAAKTVTKRPMLALGVAFVIGMAIGIALSKSSD